jgi:L-alanine-DL-glutamate epimerase-like enolase superfamily enzyme
MGNNEEDVAQTLRVYRGVKDFGVEVPILTLDTNEANPDSANVLEFLEALEEADADAYAAVFYLEQPTARDIETHAFDWREVATRKPVFLDEGLTSIETLRLAEEQGWSGLALKTCKGHSFALVAAAWANERDLQVALQDLTNTGYAAIHAALFASSIPMINGVEINSPQFMPDANAEWLPRMEGLFEVKDGLHQVPTENVVGLGANL